MNYIFNIFLWKNILYYLFINYLFNVFIKFHLANLLY